MKTQRSEIDAQARYERFIDTIRLSLILWRRSGEGDLADVARKLGISERTARRRYKSPGTLTLEEFFAWCELYGKEPNELLRNALDKKDSEPE